MAFTKFPVGVNDSVLLVALCYSTVDIYLESGRFSTCAKPINSWLFVSYAAIICFRAAHLLGSHHRQASALETKEFLLNFREANKVSWSVMFFTWTIALPFYAAWTVLGTSWLWTVRVQTPLCLPPGQCWWFMFLWLGMSYVWVGIHGFLSVMACVLEFRVRKAEWRLRQIQDGDVISRWGNVSQLPSYSVLTGSSANGGLDPAEISALPTFVASGDYEIECSICLCEVNAGDKIRSLDSCGHTFHRSCIDLWLLRRGDCPLCKRTVTMDVRTRDLTILGP